MTDVFRMLQIFVGGRDVRLLVLNHLTNHPDQAFYPAELAEKLHLPEPSVRRALRFLARHGLLASSPTRYRHYFWLQGNLGKVRHD